MYHRSRIVLSLRSLSDLRGTGWAGHNSGALSTSMGGPEPEVGPASGWVADCKGEAGNLVESGTLSECRGKRRGCGPGGGGMASWAVMEAKINRLR